MAAIRSYRTRAGERRYEVRFRDAEGKQRSRSFSVAKDARAFKLEVERKQQAGTLYQPPSERFDECARAWLDRFERGAAGRVRPRPRTVATVRELLSKLAPLNELPLERIRRPVVEDLATAGGRDAAPGPDGVGAPQAHPAECRGARPAHRSRGLPRSRRDP
jgi:hypothetical protein